MLFNSSIENVIFSKIKNRKVKLLGIDKLNKVENGMNVVIVGLPDKYKDEINMTLENVKFIDTNVDFDPQSLDNSYLILISKTNCNYALSYKVECLANKKRIPVGNLAFDEDSKSIDNISETAMYDFTY